MSMGVSTNRFFAVSDIQKRFHLNKIHTCTVYHDCLPWPGTHKDILLINDNAFVINQKNHII